MRLGPRDRRARPAGSAPIVLACCGLLLAAAVLVVGCPRKGRTAGGESTAASESTPPRGRGAAKPPSTTAKPAATPSAPARAKPSQAGAKPSGQAGAAVPATGIAWVTGLDQALATAKQDDKPVLVVCVYRDMGGSTALRGEAFLDAAVRELCPEFVCVQLDVEKDPAGAERLGVRAAPTVYVLSPGGAVLHKTQGYGGPAGLAAALRQGLRAFRAGAAGAPAAGQGGVGRE